MAKVELLAPAGDMASLAAAVASGADAVYFGLEGLSARRSFAEFTLDEAGAARRFAHSRSVKVYPALNSLVKGRELGRVMEALDFLAALPVDGLIVQDLGVYHLARRHFPGLPLHSSTLFAAHNSAGVAALKKMGFTRVVLAREMSLEEVGAAARIEGVDLEVFVHGALCFSISGLCLASSFYGGKSGLRGLCTQPCRRLFRKGAHKGRYLSAADLSLIEHARGLKELGIRALKIEGRMKRPDYVAGVVAAYRSVLDAREDELASRVKDAKELLGSLSGRRLSTGHLMAETSPGVLIPHLSGASGRLVARVAGQKGDRALIKVRQPFRKGDVLRPETGKPKEQRAFRVREITVEKKRVGEARAGDRVNIRPDRGLGPGANLFLVSRTDASRRWEAEARRLIKVQKSAREPKRWRSILDGCPRRREPGEERLYIKVGRVDALREALALPADGVFLCGGLGELRRLTGRVKTIRKAGPRLGVGLPPVIFEESLKGYAVVIGELAQMGIERFLVANVGHLELFEGCAGRLMGDYTLNVLSGAGLCAALELGMDSQVLSLEADLDTLGDALRGGRGAEPVVSIYARPPLLVSRFKPFSGKKAELSGPKGERLVAEAKGGLSLVYEQRPLCLFGHLREIREMGLRSFIIDLSHERAARGELRRLFEGYKRMKPPKSYSIFNLTGGLE